ncbi:helix-turn-helix domain-containing protein [Chryseobacterium daeguense]|uniref:helix-turn-helix domain-containing protein n=1 Tax=Chryseobacterium daeguense TaxID=412438 RepID=UPI0004887F45|nr:helix-turn-helix transcriptional regulator [Chryseobacterium daeguense]
MNDVISKNIRKHRELKGFSQEYMANQLNINQASYAKIENNSTKLTVERLFAISKLLETEITDLLDLKNQTIYNIYDNQHGVGSQHIQNLYQDNKEVYEKLIQAKDEQIALLKEMLDKRN